MASKKPVKRAAPKSAIGFSEEEKAAAREMIRERRARASGKVDGETEVQAKIAEMPSPDRELAKRFHALIRATAPSLTPRTWYGMPAYSKDDDVLLWFQPASKFKARYSFFGFGDDAKLDEGHMWPVSYAITELTPTEEARIVALVKKALSTG
jgi:hypothetical protein